MIALVEDDTVVRHSVKLLLSMRYHGVGDCRSAGEAIEPDLRGKQTCLIADYILPDMDTISSLGALGERGWKAPAILITGFFGTTLAGRARDAGYVAVYQKPFVHDELVDAVAPMACSQ
jgi:FixJ family two-component response regulator